MATPKLFEMRQPTPDEVRAKAQLDYIIWSAADRIAGKRDEALAKLLLAKLAGLQVRLVEERSADGLKTTWIFEGID